MFRWSIPLGALMERKDFEDLEKTFVIDVPQPPRGVLRERCSENMQQNYGRTLMKK